MIVLELYVQFQFPPLRESALRLVAGYGWCKRPSVSVPSSSGIRAAASLVSVSLQSTLSFSSLLFGNPRCGTAPDDRSGAVRPVSVPSSSGIRAAAPLDAPHL